MKLIRAAESEIGIENDSSTIDFEGIYSKCKNRFRTWGSQNLRRFYWHVLMTQLGWNRALKYFPRADEESELDWRSRFEGFCARSLQHARFAYYRMSAWVYDASPTRIRDDLARKSLNHRANGENFVSLANCADDSKRLAQLSRMFGMSLSEVEQLNYDWEEFLRMDEDARTWANSMPDQLEERIDWPFGRTDRYGYEFKLTPQEKA